MKTNIILVALCVLMSSTARAQLPEAKMKSHANMMEQKLKLASFIQEIQKGNISSKRTSILYAILQNTSEVCIHQQNGAKDNQVYVHQDGHKEAVYDKNGKLVQDGINDGSYNYFHPTKQPLYHFTFDISPWIMWGQSRTDSTTVKSRIYVYMGDLEGGIRKAIKQKQKLRANWKDDGQIQALAVFMRAIEEGKADALFALFEPEAKMTDKQLIDVLTRLNSGLEKVYSVSNKALDSDKE